MALSPRFWDAFAIKMLEKLIQFDHVDVSLNGQTVLRDLNWQLRSGQHWAILGRNGSGKSTFLKLVRGDLWPAPGRGRRLYCFNGELQTNAVGIKEKIGLVSPELQERYLQQDWTLSGLQVVQTCFFNSDYLYEKLTSKQITLAASIIRLLDLEALINRNIQQLSTGELRKVLIARALAGEPRILLLDEVCDGLDSRSRAQLLQTVERVARAGTQILYTTHRIDEIIPAITHELLLDQGRIVTCRATSRAGVPPASAGVSPAKHTPAIRSPSNAGETPRMAGGTLAPLTLATTLIRIQRGNVFLDRKRVLQDIDWELRADQHWVILGANGAGKSTLLKLIFGDLHLAVGGTIRRFDLTARHTIWDLKKRIGFVSPHFQANYRAAVTGAEVIASGFFSSVGLIESSTATQKRKVRQLLNTFGLASLGAKSILEMSYGEFRAVLTLRALVHQPQVLILDEPFDGLDAPAKSRFSEALDQVSRNGTRLIIVTHHPGDLPACITHALLLDKGRILCQGEWKAVQAHPDAQLWFASDRS